MSELYGTAGWPEDFCGKVRLFPLPNLVLFPHVIQPLHIFEPRYCDMLQEALATDQLISMALLREGWEKTFNNQPAIAEAVCVGKILSHTPTEDGRHNILLLGLKRGRIVQEISSGDSFRRAEVEILEDEYPLDEVGNREELAQKLQELFARFVPDGQAAQKSFKDLIGRQLPLGVLTDTITYAIGLPVEIKQQLLAEANVDIRCRILMRCLEQKISMESSASGGGFGEDFPPKFSNN